MELTYKKNNNTDLFNDFKCANSLNILEIQNYIPIYNKYFNLNSNNYNTVNLNNDMHIQKVNSKLNNNIFNCEIGNNDKTKHVNIFFKYGPLLDPTKYLMGTYDLSDNNLFDLPTFKEDNTVNNKIYDENNSAYVDGFFYYLSSQLLNTHNFINGINFYGGFLGKKRNFEYNIIDDIDILSDSEFFHENNNSLFKITSSFASQLLNIDTRKNKERLVFGEESSIDIDNESDLSELNNIFSEKLPETASETASELDLLFEDTTIDNKDKLDSGDCSSTSSHTSNNSTMLEDDLSEDYSEYDNSTASEDSMIISINSFPVKIMALENCDSTLDSLIVEQGEKMKDEEWGSMILQVIIILYTYQKTFSMTHNDLHSNNIMYNKTEKQYLYYKVRGNYYKIPTFGKIYKFIDFGRAIYKFKGKVICSDSYHKDGDAATLYNTEPYFNSNKPRLEPNFSFDLCRLGCSLLDFFIEDLEENPNDPRLAAKRIIQEWCIDDKGRNVLYKKNMTERYPEFKLYKMIARTVHNHTPENQLDKEYFDKFKISKKKINKNNKVINIDNIPSYVE